MKKILFVFLFFLLLTPDSLFARTYTLGMPDRRLSATYTKLFESLEGKGYIQGKNLKVIKIPFDGYKSEEGKKQIKRKIEKETDLFFTTGEFLKAAFEMELKSPVMFLGLKEVHKQIPDSMKDNTTGAWRDSAGKIFSFSMNMLPHDAKRSLGFIYRQGRTRLSAMVSDFTEYAAQVGITLIPKEYAVKEDLERIMREFKPLVSAVLLYPPSIKSEDFDTLINWQNNLNLPIIAQLRKDIQKGVLGGPTLNYNEFIPVLADYADKIFRGKSAGKLPLFSTSSKYIINLKTASQLKVNIPKEVLRKAEIIGIGGKSRTKRELKASLRKGSFIVALPQKKFPLEKKYLAEMEKLGYVMGKNLSLLDVSIEHLKDPEKAKEISRRVNEKADLIIISGNTAKVLLPWAVKQDILTPILYAGVKGSYEYPEKLKAQTTSVWRARRSKIFQMVENMLPDKKAVTLLYREGNGLGLRLPLIMTGVKGSRLELNKKMIKMDQKIEVVLKDLKTDFILLYPPSLPLEDIPPLVQWQFRTKTPVVSQLLTHIKMGVFGGPAFQSKGMAKSIAEKSHQIISGRPVNKLKDYEFPPVYTINLRSAKRIGLAIPRTIIKQATIVR